MDRIWYTFLTYARANGIEISNDSKEKTAYSYARAPNHPAQGYLLADLNGNRIPRLEANEHYKYLDIFIALDLSWQRQQTETERSIIKQLGFLRRSAFNGEQCITVLNRVLMPSILYRCQVVPFGENFLKECEIRMLNLLKSKFRLASNTAASYFLLPKAENGLGLLSLRALAPAYLMHRNLRFRAQ
jgi:hypothetical protein